MKKQGNKNLKNSAYNDNIVESEIFKYGCRQFLYTQVDINIQIQIIYQIIHPIMYIKMMIKNTVILFYLFLKSFSYESSVAECHTKPATTIG